MVERIHVFTVFILLLPCSFSAQSQKEHITIKRRTRGDIFRNPDPEIASGCKGNISIKGNNGADSCITFSSLDIGGSCTDKQKCCSLCKCSQNRPTYIVHLGQCISDNNITNALFGGKAACDFNLPTTGVPGGHSIDPSIMCRPELPTLYLNYEETQTMMDCKLAYGDTLDSCKVTSKGSKYLYDSTWLDIWPNNTDQDIFSVDVDSSPKLLLKWDDTMNKQLQGRLISLKVQCKLKGYGSGHKRSCTLFKANGTMTVERCAPTKASISSSKELTGMGAITDSTTTTERSSVDTYEPLSLATHKKPTQYQLVGGNKTSESIDLIATVIGVLFGLLLLTFVILVTGFFCKRRQLHRTKRSTLKRELKRSFTQSSSSTEDGSAFTIEINSNSCRALPPLPDSDTYQCIVARASDQSEYKALVINKDELSIPNHHTNSLAYQDLVLHRKPRQWVKFDDDYHPLVKLGDKNTKLSGSQESVDSGGYHTPDVFRRCPARPGGVSVAEEAVEQQGSNKRDNKDTGSQPENVYNVLEGPSSAAYDKGLSINDYNVLEGPETETYDLECPQNHYNVLEKPGFETWDSERLGDDVGMSEVADTSQRQGLQDPTPELRDEEGPQNHFNVLEQPHLEPWDAEHSQNHNCNKTELVCKEKHSDSERRETNSNFSKQESTENLYNVLEEPTINEGVGFGAFCRRSLRV